MTLPYGKNDSLFSRTQILLSLFSLFCMLLLLRNAATAAQYILQGLVLCARTVVPALFPFLVLSEWFLAVSGNGLLLQRVFTPLCRLFSLPPAGCQALLLGLLCGFPVGTLCALGAYGHGEISARECEHILACGSPPSAAFVIGAVGISLFGSRRLGITLYLCTLAVCVLFAILLGILQKRETAANPSAPASYTPVGGAKGFTNAVRASAEKMLLICAYVIFFSALTGTVSLMLTRLQAPAPVHHLLGIALELSSGIHQAANGQPTVYAAVLCAGALGWSGLSVHCQMLSLCDGYPLRFRSYFLLKLLQGLTCALILFLLLRTDPFHLLSNATSPSAADWFYLI
ncbi:MAG: hypothetical protein IJW30_06030 [Clostridia bacterium]|nr:hypothetical protein [Clostridia bacterium]MBQ9774206.1 hypothetical protein [Clostridia bacterium]